jgi:hypothetical protein
MREYFDSLMELSGAREPWRPLQRWAVIAWLIFFLWFLTYAFSKHGGFSFYQYPEHGGA